MRSGKRLGSKVARVLSAGRWASVTRRSIRRWRRPSYSCSSSSQAKASSDQFSCWALLTTSPTTWAAVVKRKARRRIWSVSSAVIAPLASQKLVVVGQVHRAGLQRRHHGRGGGYTRRDGGVIPGGRRRQEFG